MERSLLERKTNGTTESFVYDAIGNPTTYRNHKLKWSHGRNLMGFGDIQYEYNAQGLRISKTVGGSKVKYIYGGDKLMCAERKNSVIWFNYGVSGVTGLTVNGKDYYYQKNLQGDVINILDCVGNIVVKYAYDAWGSHKIVEDTSGISLGTINPIRYRSYFYDTETKLYYLKSRYYDPELGRFINADDVSYLDPETINGLNLYAYCGSNPVMRVDPSGRFFLLTLLIIAAATVAVTSISGGIIAAVNGGSFWQGFADGALFGVSALAVAGGALLMSMGMTRLGGALMGFGIGSIAGGFYSMSVGGSFGDGWVIGGATGAIIGASGLKNSLSLIGGLIGGVLGGLVSWMSGDGFMSGFVSGGLGGLMGGNWFAAGAITAGFSLINDKAKDGHIGWDSVGRAVLLGLVASAFSVAGFKSGKEFGRAAGTMAGLENKIFGGFTELLFGVVGWIISTIISTRRN